MKSLIASLVILFSLVGFPHRALAGWTMIFHDEFDGPTLDHDKWFTRGGDGKFDHLNDEVQHYSENNNHVFKDGHLELTARYLGDDKYESGSIISKRDFYYGYYEARVKLPSGVGVWPAFWLCPDLDAQGKTAWPPELDVFEFVNNGKDDKVNVLHTPGGDNPIYADPHYHHNGYVSDVDLTKDWHVVGMMWLPDTVSMYMDGVKIYTMAYKWEKKDGKLAPPAEITLNLALGGQWAGRYGIDKSAFPQSLDVDYVRVYQYDDKTQNTLTLSNVPDLANYHYSAPGDLIRPTVFPAEVPKSVKPGEILNVIYHIDTVPTLYRTDLRMSINKIPSGESVYEHTFQLPHDTRQEAATLKARAGLAVPSNLVEGDYDVRLALSYCLIAPCPPGDVTNIPLTTTDGTARELNAWYRVGHIRIED